VAGSAAARRDAELQELQAIIPDEIKHRSRSEPGLSWTGRGKKPAWVAAWLNQGKSLEDLKAD